jgi:hypothetical protein
VRKQGVAANKLILAARLKVLGAEVVIARGQERQQPRHAVLGEDAVKEKDDGWRRER